MRDDLVRLSTIWRLLRMRWRLLSAMTILGALLGVGASFLFSPGYATTATVLLQGPRDENELSTEAQVATSSHVLERAAIALGWGIPGDEVGNSVTAAVTDGNVIQVTGTASSPQRAQELANNVAKEYVAYSAELASYTSDASSQVLREQQESLRKQVANTNQTITNLARSAQTGTTVESVQARTQLESLKGALSDAMTKLDQSDSASGQARTVVMGSAELPSSPAAPTITQFVGGGAILFLVIGMLGHLVRARTDRRIRNEPGVAAALNAPVLGSLDIPEEPVQQEQRERPTGWRDRLLRLLKADEPWNLPESRNSADDSTRDLRYGRVVSRIRQAARSNKPLLALVENNDAIACRTGELLAAVAAKDGRGTELRITEVNATHPTVPESAEYAGAVVVLTAGTRTAWELVGIAEACTDAGQVLLGAIVTHPARLTDDTRALSTTPEVPVHSDAMAGTT